MATIVHEHVAEHENTSGNNMSGTILGLVLAIILALVLFYFGLPALRGTFTPAPVVQQQAPVPQIPNKVDVNIKGQK